MLMVSEARGNFAEAALAENLLGDGVVGLDFTTPRYWRAFIAMASKEQRAADWLREARIRVYWPNYSVSQAVGVSSKGWHINRARLRALIPGFLFVAVRQNAEVDLGAIVENTPGIIGYMRDGAGYAATLTERDITMIRQIEASENKPALAKHVHIFRIGQKVRFSSAQSWSGKIVEFCSDGRISVGVPMLGRTVSVKGLPHQIEAV